MSREAPDRPLSLVEGGTERSRPRPEDPPPSPGSSRRSFWLLVAALLVALLALGLQTRRVEDLEGRVAGLTRELGSAQEALAAYESHLGEVRGLVGDLGARLEDLRDLVSRDPRQADPEEAGESL